jgi:hypothetical protein
MLRTGIQYICDSKQYLQENSVLKQSQTRDLNYINLVPNQKPLKYNL